MTLFHSLIEDIYDVLINIFLLLMLLQLSNKLWCFIFLRSGENDHVMTRQGFCKGLVLLYLIVWFCDINNWCCVQVHRNYSVSSGLSTPCCLCSILWTVYSTSCSHDSSGKWTSESRPCHLKCHNYIINYQWGGRDAERETHRWSTERFHLESAYSCESHQKEK